MGVFGVFFIFLLNCPENVFLLFFGTRPISKALEKPIMTNNHCTFIAKKNRRNSSSKILSNFNTIENFIKKVYVWLSIHKKGICLGVFGVFFIFLLNCLENAFLPFFGTRPISKALEKPIMTNNHCTFIAKKNRRNSSSKILSNFNTIENFIKKVYFWVFLEFFSSSFSIALKMFFYYFSEQDPFQKR